MNTKSLLLAICFAHLICLFNAQSSVEINVLFSGSTCTLCGVTNFDYTIAGTNASASFLDPIPNGYVVTQITITTTAMYWCEDNANLDWYVGETPVGIGMTNDYNCVCGQCPPTVSSSSSNYPNGFPGYMYGQYNSLIVSNMADQNGGSVGVAVIAMSLEFSKGGGGNMNVSVMVPYEGCGFCDLCGSQNYALSNGVADCGEGTWDDGYRYFQDPTPAGATVVQITVFTTSAFWCDGPTTANFTVDGVLIGTSPAINHECQCNSCPAPQAIQSQMYSNGFPKYMKGRENYIQVSAMNGVIGIGSLEIVVTYQEMGSAENKIINI